jgi:hypothetical protein
MAVVPPVPPNPQPGRATNAASTRELSEPLDLAYQAVAHPLKFPCGLRAFSRQQKMSPIQADATAFVEVARADRSAG